ncbi:MAG: ABC transporter ATP-binding protein [Actinomyces urogenitalis]|uniref:ABC transporter ATP-binding protein n=1 Tax=Actinomyces urogenitalis TaxID=103621 RepID=UPI002A805550|nr:ABC transporter ATP-binding protein [Actinomyces urogenitalis]MDY3677853.1 ABC transporter ATP-binding protein [Actinomyces urogenitalis]
MTIIRTYRHYLGVLFNRGERWQMVLAALGSFVLGLMETASVLVVAPLVLAMGTDWRAGSAGLVASHLGITQQDQLVTILLGVTIGGFILKDLLAIAYSWWLQTFTSSIRARAQMRMTEHYMRLPYHAHGALSAATIMRKTTTCAIQAYTNFAGGLLSLTSQAFTTICVSAALLVSAPVVSLVLLVFITVMSWWYSRVIRPFNARISQIGLESWEESVNATLDTFGAIKETQLREAYPHFLRRIEAPTLTSARLSRTAGFLNSLPKQLIEILFMLGLAVAFAASSALGASQNMLASLALLVAGAFRLLPTVSAMVGSLATVKQGEYGTKEFVEDLTYSQHLTTCRAAQQGTSRTILSKQLVLTDVRFSYSEKAPEVLRGISLTIEAGSSVALVGSSGAGKSTLLDIIMGLQTPTSGSFTCDGIDLTANLRGWQKNIGVVPQEVFLMDTTIAENVAFDLTPEEIDEDRVRLALRQADVLDFVEAQPQGIWSSFGERGKRLSGGQRQRIGIARALYRQPSVLILDEATSALDNETEARIAETIEALHGQITVITVAHRLSTVRHADKIAFLADGRVEASGTFTALQESSPGFRRLVELSSLEDPSA